MTWLGRLLLLIPAMIAGWFVSRNDPRFWVIAMTVGLVFLFLFCLITLYASRLSSKARRRRRRP